MSTLFALMVGAAAFSTTVDANASTAKPAARHPLNPKSGWREVTLTTSSKQLEEGERFSLTAVVKSPAKATRVTLEKWYVPLYFGEPTWQPVKTRAVKGKRSVTFRAVATELNTARYRVAVTYERTQRASVSQPVGVTIWRWIPLSEYDPYYKTSGVAFGEATINGVRYVGWGASVISHDRVWEARFTPGRHCRSFEGVLGVGDISDDGSSGTIKVTADDELIYESPALTPGMDLPVTISFAKPYRFGIQLFDTSPDGIESWPVIGEPHLLCTGA